MLNIDMWLPDVGVGRVYLPDRLLGVGRNAVSVVGQDVDAVPDEDLFPDDGAIQSFFDRQGAADVFLGAYCAGVVAGTEARPEGVQDFRIDVAAFPDDPDRPLLQRAQIVRLVEI